MNSMQMKWTTALLSIGLMLAACGGNTSQATNTNTSDPNVSGVADSNSPLYDRAKKWASDNPTRQISNASWDQGCGVLMVQFANVPPPPAPGNAIDGYRHSNIEKDADGTHTTSAKAPIGVFHWWKIDDNTYHVGLDLNGGGKTIFMATTHIAESWAKTADKKDAPIGVNSVEGYEKDSGGAVYQGWSKDYAGNEIDSSLLK